MRRRALLATPLLLGLPRVAAALPSGGYRFRVLREGSPIGTHTVRREVDGSVRTNVNLEVKLLSFTVFRYVHDYAERWRDDRLVGFASRTLRDGREARLELVASGDALQGRGPEGAVRLPAEAAPLSWWEPRHMQRPLFDAGTGQLLAARPQRDRSDGLTRWRAAEREMAALYDAGDNWVGFTMRGEDGSAIRYEAG